MITSNLKKASRIFFRRSFYAKVFVFAHISVFAFLPLGNLINLYSSEYLPEPIADQIAEVIPSVSEANATDITDKVIFFFNPASASSDLGTGMASGAGNLGTDWVCISCTATSTYSNYFVVGSTSFGIGGAKNHTHTSTNANDNSAATAKKSAAGTAGSATAHNHPTTTVTWPTANNYPKYARLMMIKYIGPLPLTQLPDNIIGMFDVASYANLPSGWSPMTSLEDRIIIASDSADPVNAGSDTHNHSLSVSLSGTASSRVNTNGTGNAAPDGTHGHSAVSVSTDTQANVPQHASLIFATTNGTVSNLTDVIAMFESSPDAGSWTVLSGSGGVLENDFIEASTSYSAAPGGSNTHNHADLTGQTSGSSDNTNVSTGNGTGLALAHTHPFSVTDISTVNQRPPYKGIIFAKGLYPPITISGTCRQSDQSTACSDTGSNVIRVAVNGTLQAQTDATVDGSWSIVNVAQPTAGQIITVFIEGEASSASQAVAITEWSSGDVTGVELIESHLTIGSNQGTTISNADLGDYDSSVSGKKTFHDNSGTTLTVDADSALAEEELYIGTSNTYTPGGTVNTYDLEIRGTFNPEANSINLSGTWDDNGTFNASTSTINMTGFFETLDASTFNNLIINPSGSGVINASGSFTVSGTLTVASGDTFSLPMDTTLTHSGSTLTLAGTITGDGTLKETASGFSFPATGTIEVHLIMDTVNGNQTLSARTYSAPITIENSGSTAGRTVTLDAGTHNYLSIINIAESGTGSVTLTGSANNPTVNLSYLNPISCSAGSNNLVTGSGTWTAAWSFNLSSCTATITSGHTLVMNGSGTLTSAGNTLQNVTLGTITLANATHTIAGNLDMTIGTVTPGSSTVTMSGTNNTINGGGNTLANLTIDPSSAGTITMQTSNLTVSGTLTVSANDKFKIESGRTLTLSGTGTPLSVSGTFEPDDGSTVIYTGSATVTGTTFGNLTLGDGADNITLPSSGTPTIKGNLTIASGATIASGSATLLFRAGGTQSVTDNNASPKNLGEIAVRASTSGNTTLTLGSSVRISSASVDASQTLNLNGSNTLTITGTGDSLTASGSFGTFTPSTGTVVFTGNGATNIPTLDYFNLKVQPSADSTTHTFNSGTASVSGLFTAGNGTNTSVTITADTNNTGLDVASVSISANTTLVADGSSEFTVSRDFVNNGTFTHSSGLVTFEGPRTSSVSGATTFNNFTSTTAGKKIKFQAGTIFTFAGTFTITGADGNNIKIESTASASQWLPHFNSAQSAVTYATITDSGCDAGSSAVTLDATSTNGGNNDTDCWVFGVAGATFTQNDWEWFYDNDALNPAGSIMNAENINAEIGTNTTLPRLRINLTVGGTLSATSNQFKLQYAVSPNGPWTDVGTGAWVFKNTAVSDGDTLTQNLLSTTNVLQTYNETNPTINSNPNSATNGQNIEYDWALDPANATNGVNYAFRMIKSNDAVLDGYNSDGYPRIRITVSVEKAGGGGGASGPNNEGASGGGSQQTGGGAGESEGGSGTEGETGGGNQQTGGGGGGGTDGGSGGSGASPVLFEFWWLFGNISSTAGFITSVFLALLSALAIAVVVFVERRIRKKNDE